MNLRSALLVAALCIVSAGAGFGLYRWLAPSLATDVAQLQPPPVFHDLAGAAHPLAEWRGKLLLLNFWATWCAPCIEEIPALVRAQAEYGARGLQVVGVAADEPDAVRAFQTRFAMNYPVMIGQAEVFAVMDALGDSLQALPFTVLVAPDGRIVARVSGGMEPGALRDLLSSHLPP